MSVNASLSGTGTYSAGVQVRNDASFGDHLFVQPNNTSNYLTSGSNFANGNNATYVFSFPTPVTNFSMVAGGLNNDDGTTIVASHRGAPVQITAANFSNLSAGMSFRDADNDDESDTVVSTNTGGGIGVTTNTYSLSITEPVDTITVITGKEDDSNSTATLGFSLVEYCANPDYGDAPISYDDTAGGGTLNTSDDPARHAVSSTVYLGSALPDAETAPQSSATADGDDAICGDSDR